MADRHNPAGTGFMVEEFITSITTQLDRVQDALRIKAVNRPLTYALKELHLELKVFVDMDPQGQVLLRAAGPNEAGASTLAMDFTTITKPMIEENTISLAASRSAPLDSLGLKPEEQMKLERLGVTNLAQLERLKGSTGVNTVARMADVPIERLRRALQAGQPRLGGVVAPRPPVAMPAPVQVPPPPPRQPQPRPAPVFTPGPRRLPVHSLRPLSLDDEPPFPEGQAALPDPAAVLEVHPSTRSLALGGSHLLHEGYPPEVRLNGEALEIEELDDDRLVVRLPEHFEPGALEVRLGDLEPHCYALVHPFSAEAYAEPYVETTDPWAPAGGRA
ncbi:hypothetical protein [Sphaerotilus microaerophilus]|uniref:Uncharacterized protein n=1 Tax=Sphaerotilus microaerophilus TaxID=2914710 RepID=A0ABM7YNJ6_9BURK|nr:hypothetical protein [Sphaerotilus sp. FB-5]BDI06061.1 hypothetical protein CATMQ487_30310 [Sphaerotilus sp. FB-5]